MPLVSIGLPVYNGENYLRESIESVLCQTFKDFELIISDNCSTDNTNSICMEYVRRDSRVKCFKNSENIGYAGNFNNVFNSSTGVYFKWIAHDDIINERFLEKCIFTFNEYPDIIGVFPGLSYIDVNRNMIERRNKCFDIMQDDKVKRLREFINYEMEGTEDVFWAIYGLFKRETLKISCMHGAYVAADRVLLMHLALLGKIKSLDENLLYIRKHPESSMVRSRVPKDRYSWCNTKYVPKYVLPNWNLYYNYYKLVFRHKMGFIVSMRAFYEITRKMFIKDLRTLVGEIKFTVKEYFYAKMNNA